MIPTESACLFGFLRCVVFFWEFCARLARQGIGYLDGDISLHDIERVAQSARPSSSHKLISSPNIIK